MRDAALPPAFASLSGIVRYVQQESATTYTSTCPKCGDSGHSGNKAPDRFTMFDDEHPTGFCRRCGYLWYPDQGEGYKPPNAEELAARTAFLREREEARKRSAERALEHLRSSNVASRYHDALDDYARRYWLRRGVPRALQDWWQLGWAAQHDFFINGAPYLCDAATIPLFSHEWEIQNIKMRLEPAPSNGGKYRYAIAGQGEPLFRCDPDLTLDGQHVYAVEGEIKSMVTWGRLDDSHCCMVGMPGATPSTDVVTELSKAERVTLVMDPGAKAQGIRLAKAIGLHKCWLLETAAKIDDAILEKQLTAREVRRWLHSALKVDAFVTV